MATSVQHGVGKNGEAVEGSFFVDAFGYTANGAIVPGKDRGRKRMARTEWVAEDVAQQTGLAKALCPDRYDAQGAEQVLDYAPGVVQ
jgi:hypothetical protein